jgi:TRAP-type C4-dicarboxylate transport system substrate-binding protein
MDRTIAARLVALAAFAAAVSGGCASASHDRVGGVVGPDSVVLTLAVHGDGTDVREWAASVRRLSGGSVRIELRPGWRHAEVDYEWHTVADVRAGRADLALIPARAFDTMGVTAFQGLLAPFLVDSYDVERSALASDLPARMLAGAGRLGVGGVALVPGPLERTLGDGMTPLGPDSYRFATVGVRPSALTAASLHALGATARPLAPGGDIDPLDGAEQSLEDVVANHYAFVTPGRTLALNAVLWPAIGAIVVNRAAYAALAPDQRAALQRAGTVSVAPAVRQLARSERDAERVLCRPPHADDNLFQFTRTTPSDLAALRRAVRPVYRRLERDTTGRAVIRAITTMRQSVAPAPAVVCRGGAPHPFHPPAVPRLQVTGDLRRVSEREWRGPARSNRLGRGSLTVWGSTLFRDFAIRRSMSVRAVFRRGQIEGFVDMGLAPARSGAHTWNGPGVVFQTTPRLHRYLHASLRFRGITRAGDPDDLDGGFVTDMSTGLH